MSLHELRRKAHEALARRWLASKHWGGARDGMVDASPGNEGSLVYGSNIEGVPLTLWQGPGSRPMQRLSPEFLPDLDHPGTRAFLLEDVRRAWGFLVSCPFSDDGGRTWHLWRGRHCFRGPTEASALIAALEAAP